MPLYDRYLLVLSWDRPLQCYIVLKYSCIITMPGHHLRIGPLVATSAPLRDWDEIHGWHYLSRWYDAPWPSVSRRDVIPLMRAVIPLKWGRRSRTSKSVRYWGKKPYCCMCRLPACRAKAHKPSHSSVDE